MIGWLFLALLAAGAFAIGWAMVLAPRFLGPRPPKAPVKAAPYECGVPIFGSPRETFPVAYYLVAVLFVLFDIEVVFLVPWAVVYREFGASGLLAAGAFLGVIAYGLLYAWRRGALDWYPS